jgi:Ca2+-binding EF-hand superfamily protein
MLASITFAFGGKPFLHPKSEQFKQSVQHMLEEETAKKQYANTSFDQMQADEFKLLDRNGDGVVHVHELEEVKKKLKDRAAKEGNDKLQTHESSLMGKLENDHADWYGTLDGDGNGHVTLEEHKEFWAAIKSTAEEVKTKQNKATAEEFKTKKNNTAISEIDLTDIHDIQKQQFETMDANSDGSVSKEEMLATINKLKARKELDGGKGLTKHDDSLLGKLEEGPDNIHDKSDANGDGHLTWDEYKFKKPDGPQPAEL